MKNWIAPLLCAAALAACENPEQAKRPPTPPADMRAAQPLVTPRATDGWIGHWTGPEGTALDISRSGDGYRIVVTDLDGPKTYEGTPAKNHIEFVRGGKTESIRSGSGKDTRMKWLLEKADCLVIRDGEGYCRD